MADDWGAAEDDSGWGDDEPKGKKKKKSTPTTEGDDGWGSFAGDAEEGDQDMGGDIEETKALTLTRQNSYNILDMEHIRGKQKKIIQDAAEEMNVSTEEAGALLRHYGWNLGKLTTDWYKGSDKVRAKVGLSKRKSEKPPAQVQCIFAFCDLVPSSEALGLACGHWLCNEHWSDFLTAQIANGRGCVFTSCPGFKCKKALCQHSVKQSCKCEEMVPDELFRQFVKDTEQIKRYDRWVLDSFVEGTKIIRWCPRPGCDRAVEYEAESARDVVCVCGTRFCFLCSQEAHTPAPCDLAKRYKDKGSSDLATEQLLAATTKKCPKCEVLITKNKACNHMSCMKCRHQFCWLCKGDWKDHGSQSGGYYVCKKYNEDKEKGVLPEEERKMVETQKFMQSLAYQKYLYYRTRFDHHQKAARFAAAFIEKVEKGAVNLSEYNFLIEAARKLIVARNVLQWTFCLAFFLKDSSNKKRFEFQLDMLNNFSEELQDMLEKEDNIKVLIETKLRMDIVKRSRTLDDFRKKMVEVTEEPSFQTLLGNEWGGTDDGSWGCLACSAAHSTEEEKKLKHCKTCQACRNHGEPACRVPECAPPGGLH